MDAIGQRVDIPRSMVVVKVETHQVMGALPGGSRVEIVRVEIPKLQRTGFPSELEDLYLHATQKR